MPTMSRILVVSNDGDEHKNHSLAKEPEIQTLKLILFDIRCGTKNWLHWQKNILRDAFSDMGIQTEALTNFRK